MKIDGKQLSESILEYVKKKLNKKARLVVFSVKPKAEDLSFIKAKEKAAAKIGAQFELIMFKKAPRFEDFARKIQEKAEDPKVTAIIIQKPLPPQLTTETIYNYVPLEKEIEGHKAKSPFIPPIGLAVLTVLKYIYEPGSKKDAKNIIVNLDNDTVFFKRILKRKRIVLMGRGETGGKPIGDVLTTTKINYINTNSRTPSDSPFYSEADVIITAAGKKVLNASMIKPGAAVINVGIRKEKNSWVGDYDEDDIATVAGFYTPTPGGVGPLDIAYLMYNLLLASKLKKR